MDPTAVLERRKAKPPRGSVLDDLREMLPALDAGAAVADENGMLSSSSLEMLGCSSLSRAPLGAAQGGCDLAGSQHCLLLFDVLRLLGSVDLSVARLYEGHVNALALVARYGSGRQNDLLAAAVRGGAMSAVWGADDARALKADAVRGGMFRLRGRKVLASGAGFVTRPLVTAATADGPLLILLELAPGERADASSWTAQGMRSTATGVIELDGLVVRPEQVVGRPGDFVRQPHLSGGAWRFCAAHLGAAERLVDLFRAQLVARQRDRDPYQLQRVALCAAAVGSAAFWIRDAAQRLANASEDDADDVVAIANLTRVVTERAALDVLEAVHRGAGLGAFLRPNPIERIGRDLSTYLRQPVPDLAMADAATRVLASSRATGDLWARS